MPDDRLFHKRLGHSDKIARLTDLEFRVWAQYELSADDFGVMRFSAVTLQADNDSLAKRQARQIQRGLEVLRDIGLIVTFEHQGRTYCAQSDWQNYQRVKHPRQTINPRPPDSVLETFTAQTRGLFAYWPGKKKETVGEDFGNPSPPVGDLARAGARETANGYRLTATGLEGGAGETTPPSRGIGAGVMAGALPRDHIRHAFCGRKCVPDFLHGEFVASVGGADPDRAVRQFYADVMDGIPDDQAIGDEPIPFWRAQFKARFGSVTAPAGKTAGNRAAAARFVARGGQPR